MGISDYSERARSFCSSISWMDDLGEAKDTMQQFVVGDLSLITAICAYADGRLDLAESDAAHAYFGVAILGESFISQMSLLDLPLHTVQSAKAKLTQLLLPMIDEARKLDFDSTPLRIGLLRAKHLADGNDTSLIDPIISALYGYANLLTKADGTVTKAEEEALRQIWHKLYDQPKEVPDLLQSSEVAPDSKPPEVAQPVETLEEVLQQLNQLVGMGEIKQEVITLTNYLKVQKHRIDRGMSKTPMSLHAVFYGPPGTGKTTIARLLGKIYRHLGFLSKGHVIETDRSGLVAGYVGQTSLKVDEIVNKSLDGVLFIDEAYTLKPDGAGNDYGQEAIDILLKRMEDYRDRLVVIAVGYTDEMGRFLKSNPGVSSRFNRYFHFDDYKPNELLAIFDTFCKKSNLSVTEGAREKLTITFEILFTNRDKTFGNGRLVRNLFEKAMERQANRIASIAPITDELLSTLTEEDIPPESLFRKKS